MQSTLIRVTRTSNFQTVKQHFGYLAATVAILSLAVAQAASIPISDASFSPTMAGWTGGSYGVTTGPLGGLSPQDGTHFIWVNAAGYVQQLNLGATVQANTTYTMQVYVGGRTDVATHGFDLRLFSGATEWYRDVSLGSELPPNLDGWITVSTTTPALRAGDSLLGGALGVQVGSPVTQTSFDLVRLDSTPGVTPDTVINPSFEARQSTEGSGNTGTVPGWTGSAYQTYNPNAAGDGIFTAGAVTDGDMGVWMFGNTLSQVTGATIQPSGVYTLSVDMLARSGHTSPATIALKSNGTTLATGNFSTADSSNWLTMDVIFDSNLGLPLGVNYGDPIEIILRQTGIASSQGMLDNVRLDIFIPEPSTAILLSLAGLVVFRRR